MGIVTNLQDACTVAGDLSGATQPVELYQPVSDLLNVGSWQNASFVVSVRDVQMAPNDSMELEVITSPVPDAGSAGLGVVLDRTLSITAPGVQRIVARSSDPSVQPLEAFVFWRLTLTPGASPGPWRLYFQVLASLKGPG